MSSRSPPRRNSRSEIPHTSIIRRGRRFREMKVTAPVPVPIPEVKEINEPIQSENVKVLSREIRYSLIRNGENTSLGDGEISDSIGNPFIEDSQDHDHQSSGGVETSSQGQYWGPIEPFPLELHEIASPPISSPTRLSLSPQLPPLPEEEITLGSFSSGESRLSNLGLHLSDSGRLVPDNTLVCYETEEPLTIVDVGTQTSICISDIQPTELSNRNLAIEDWDQFVFVDHDLEGTQSSTTTESSIISFHDEFFAVSDQSDDERLQKRIKNWPRYIQNLLEA